MTPSRILLLVAAACGPANKPAPGAATTTLILVNGDVHTSDPAHPTATAVAIAGDTIAAVGGDDEIRALAGPRTEVVDLHGASVTAGLIDAHCHLYGLGTDLESVSVRALPSEADTVRAIAEAAQSRPATEWLVGRGWDQNRWPGTPWPTRASLDAAVGDRPVALRRIDGHAMWVNSKALAAASITAATKDPAGGKILRDAKGEPTGVLIDNAQHLVDAVIPAPSPAARERRIRAAAAKAVSVGLTGVHDMGIEDATAAVYRDLANKHELPLRVYALLSGDPTNLARVRTAPEPPTGRFTMRAVKFFADGALGSRGARLRADYDDDPGNRGLWVTPPDQLAAAVDAATAGGWQVGIHAIGDAAIGAVIDAYLAAGAKYPGEHRPRVEHLQVIAPEDIPRLLEAHAIASMQPTHATSDMPWAEKRIGPVRIRGAYAWRTMLDRGVPVAAGSDFPVEDVSPLLGIYAAVTRQDAAGNPPGGWYPEQRMTLEEAIAAFTRGAAYAEGAEATRGMIAVGRSADLTVFAGTLKPDRSLLELAVARTIVGGETVYRRGSPEGAAAP